MNPKIKITCETCIYAHKLIRPGHIDVTQCRRNAPKPRADHAGESWAEWPYVVPGDWCGEFKTVISDQAPQDPPKSLN